MKVGKFIPKLKIKKDNKLSQKRVKFSFMTLNANIIEQTTKNNNKNQRRILLWSEMELLKNLMKNALSIIRLDNKPIIA